MTTGADCRLVELDIGKWYYALQQWPYGETNQYGVYGPFDTYDAATEHLGDNHANPGGHLIIKHDPDSYWWQQEKESIEGMIAAGMHVSLQKGGYR